jgi:hypothetical protein
VHLHTTYHSGHSEPPCRCDHYESLRGRTQHAPCCRPYLLPAHDRISSSPSQPPTESRVLPLELLRLLRRQAGRLGIRILLVSLLIIPTHPEPGKHRNK